MEVYFVRHGETYYNKEERLLGISDSPLNEYGKELAQITAEALKNIDFDIAYCSPMTRTRQTAEPFMKGRDIPFIIDQRLKEISFGVEEGGSIPEAKSNASHPVHKFFAKPSQYIPPKDAESFESLYERSRDFIKNELVHLESKYKKILILTHGAFIRSLINTYLNYELDDFWKTSVKNCAVTILDIENGKCSLKEISKIYY